MWQVQVLPGELYVTRADEAITTVLGSCVSACVRDVRRGVGGMNHFMLPEAPSSDDNLAPARYGVYALECLLNGVTRGGGRREDLEVKVFGGGRVLAHGGDIGRVNIDFVRRFFDTEQLAIHAEDVGDAFARRIRYWPRSGRVQLSRIPMAQAKHVVAREVATTRVAPKPGTVELF